MHELEDRMWWYRGLRALAAQLLGRTLARTGATGPVLDAGCGTGGMLATLASAVPGCPTFGLEYDAPAAALAASKSGRPVAAVRSTKCRSAMARSGIFVAGRPLPWRCRAGACPERGPSLPAARWHPRVKLACLRLAVVGARPTRAQCAAFRCPTNAHAAGRHGFRVLRSSYWNTLLFPLMLLHRLTESDEAESDVRDYPRWLDGLFAAAARRRTCR